MVPPISRARLADLLIDPHEDLNIEIKNWLDLRTSNDDKATFAKAALALANHGGGFILLGLTETPNGAIEAPGRPHSLDGYGQDLLNGIVQNYADPSFHIAVHMVANGAGALYPVIVVPGGHRVPIRARRSGPHGNIVTQNDVLVRKPGPRSEVPQNAQEWDELFARCFANRRDEMFDQIRDLITGAVPAAAPPAEPARLDQWIERCLARWRTLIDALPADSAARCPHGYYFYAYQLGGELRPTTPAEFPELLRRSVTRHSGWPPFWYPTRAGIEPYPIDGAVECWLGGDPEAGFGPRDSAHSDFWRISPEGFAFLLRGYQEDGIDAPGHEPGALFDIVLPVWRVGETLVQSERLASNMIKGPATISFIAQYTGLEGRTQTSLSGDRLVWESRTARQDEIRLSTNVEAAAIGPNLPEIVQPLLAPLYALFDFADLPMDLVATELGRMREGNH